MVVRRLLYAAVILCFVIVHAIALRKLDAAASIAPDSRPLTLQPTD